MAVEICIKVSINNKLWPDCLHLNLQSVGWVYKTSWHPGLLIDPKTTLAKSVESIFDLRFLFWDLKIQGLPFDAQWFYDIRRTLWVKNAQENSVFREWQFWSKWPKINFKTRLLRNEGLPFDAQCSKLLLLARVSFGKLFAKYQIQKRYFPRTWQG